MIRLGVTLIHRTRTQTKWPFHSTENVFTPLYHHSHWSESHVCVIPANKFTWRSFKCHRCHIIYSIMQIKWHTHTLRVAGAAQTAKAKRNNFIAIVWIVFVCRRICIYKIHSSVLLHSVVHRIIRGRMIDRSIVWLIKASSSHRPMWIFVYFSRVSLSPCRYSKFVDGQWAPDKCLDQNAERIITFFTSFFLRLSFGILFSNRLERRIWDSLRLFLRVTTWWRRRRRWRQ